MNLILRVLLSLLCIQLLFVSYGQKELIFPVMDTIQLDFRSSGVPLDFLDASFTTTSNLRPASGFGQIYEKNLAENLFYSPAGFSYLHKREKVIPKYTGLPYLGFQYAFGSNLTQDLNVEYHHFIKPKTHLHFRYYRRSSNGFLRNSDYKLNDLNLRFFHSKQKYTTHFEAYYGGYNFAQNGGIATDSLLRDFAIEFTPTLKDNAKSKIRDLYLKWDNYFRLSGDSLVGFGIKSKHQFNIINREFSEQITNLNMVDTFYLDTNGNTRDQYQTANLSNGMGFYFDSPPFKIDATINHSYWRNQNSGVYRDTHEIFLHSNLWADLGKRVTLHNILYFNTIGAIGELKEYAKLNFKITDNFEFYSRLNFENVYPTPYQRFHTANYFQWQIEDLKMQQKLQVYGGIKYGKNDFVQAQLIMTNIHNGRYFIEDTWRQDTLDFISVTALQVKGVYHIGKWGFYPSATIRFNSANFSYQPLFSTLNRISFKTKLFQAQKLGIAMGVDLGYDTKYQFTTYKGVLDLYQPVSTLLMTEALFQLNAFFALSLDQFRFFVKGENFSYLFQTPETRIDLNYPIMPFVMRIGITWDFFN